MEQILTNHQGGNRDLFLIIEGQKYNWHQQYITGIQIKNLAGISLEEEIYLSIEEPWKDELIDNEQRVNLARPEIEHFYIKKKLDYTINGTSFESECQYIKGKRIRKQGCIPENEDIFLSIKGPWTDELIEDETLVDLARPGIEHFYSKKISFDIVVNGRERVWLAKYISYSQVVELAYPNQPETDTRVYTVTYLKGPVQNPQGSMIKGDNVIVKAKMIFNVTATNKS